MSIFLSFRLITLLLFDWSVCEFFIVFSEFVFFLYIHFAVFVTVAFMARNFNFVSLLAFIVSNFSGGS